MTAYKQTELGLIPSDWEVVTYGKVFSFLSNSSYSRADLGHEGIYDYIHYGDIHTRFGSHVNLAEISLPKLTPNKIPSELLKDGDLIMADASEDTDGIGKSIEIFNIGNQKVISGLHTILLRDKNEEFSDRFRGYIHLIPSVKNQLKKICKWFKSIWNFKRQSCKYCNSTST